MSSIDPSTTVSCEAAFTSWLNEHRGLPWQETEMEKRARLAAEEYGKLTDEYDDAVCTGVNDRGVKRPVNGHEHSLVTVNARTVMKRVCDKHNVGSELVCEALQKRRKSHER